MAVTKGLIAMRTSHGAARARVALVTALSFTTAPLAPLVSAQAQPSAATKATTPTLQAPVDGGWPRAYQAAGGARILAYQPQVASWIDQKHMVAYAAVSYAASATEKPALGTLRLEGDTSVSLSERLVSFTPVKITEANFPTLPKEKTREIVAEIDKGIPDAVRVIALDRVLASIDKSQIMPKDVEGVKADPPAIFFSQTPAVLVNLDGDPIWSPIKENDLKFAVNTNWDLFLHEPTKTHYLRNEQTWLKAADLKGPWTAAGTLPGSFAKLPAADENWEEVRAALPGKAIPAGTVPAVFVSTTPAELILVNGPPKHAVVGNTKLVWVSNTESDVFRLGSTGPVYYLVAGRWFSAGSFTGPWSFATPTLPADFKEIPLEHPRSRVLASVPGTEQAAEAVLLAQVPQTARVNKKEVKAPEVAYQGDPMFDAIPPTSVSRAVNTDKDVIKFGDLYYLCFQGVWFMSKGPEGPWEVASSIPKEIYEIPASSPAHNVTYVTVVEDDDDDWVTFAAVAGYTGMMVAWGCAVWGTGWYYPPYYGWGGYYPYYFPHYPTYGYGAYYNPWTGAYGRSAVAYGPYGGAGVTARYNPRTGTYSRGAVAWGPYGARGAAQAYNPRTGTYAQTRQGSGVYGRWGSTSVQRGDDWARTSRVTNRQTGQTTRVTQGSGGGESVTRRGPQGSSTVARTGSGDVYAGHDGNVYRKEGDSWQKYESGGWNDVNRPEPTQAQRDQAQQRASDAGARARDRAATSGATTRQTDRSTIDQLNRDYQARSTGSQRTGDYGNYRSSGGSSRGGSTYRPSGGGYRGGGMRGGGGRRR
jgi:hypothetical protein